MVIVMIAIASEGIVSADSGKKVDVKGVETFEFNALFLSQPPIYPREHYGTEGDTVTWADNALTTSPHTITMVGAADLPVNFAEAYICNWNKRILGVDGPCLRFMDAHGGVPPIRQVVEVGREGDSTLLGAPSSCRRMAQPVLTSRLALAAPYTTCASFIRRCREQLQSRTTKGSK